MTREPFDVIVVGGGMAGLSCAGELVLQGARPLLICETKEVGSTLRSTWVGNNRGFTQCPTYNAAWGGGWWFALVRSLNVPIRFFPEADVEFALWADGPTDAMTLFPKCATAASLTEVLLEFSPWPIEALAPELEKVFAAGLAIPYQELMGMTQIPAMEWLQAQKVNDVTAHLVMTICATLFVLSLEDAIRHLSVAGAFGWIRSYLCGEAMLPVMYPDNRDGLCVPIARAIEERGGEVWRRSKVQQVIVEGDRARGVVLIDGTEIRAPKVALACSNARIGETLRPVPSEIEAALAYSAGSTAVDVCTYAVLDRPVTTERRAYRVVMGQTGDAVQVMWPHHAIAPWSTEPGKQFVVTEAVVGAEEMASGGGLDGVCARLADVNEAYWPGYKDAISDVVVKERHNLWFDPSFIGPKLARTIDSIQDLWFVNDVSVPVGGVCADGAASAGILGARAMAAQQ